MDACPNEKLLLDFADGRLEPGALNRVLNHIDQCQTCFRLVADASWEGDSDPAAIVPAGPREAEQLLPCVEFDEYRLIRDLGHGAMGRVVLAHDALLDRMVAIKFLTALQPSGRKRFVREARAIARVSHPNVVAIHRSGTLDGTPYIVSEYIQGRTLAGLPRPVPWKEALRIGIDLARGLAAAHRRGVLHRDIKPANAMMSEDGEVKLLDFGLAKLLAPGPLDEEPTQGTGKDMDRGRAPAQSAPDTPADADTAGAMAPTEPGSVSESAGGMRTASQTILGTPGYLAPETLQFEPATPRTDVYSVGVLLHELCTGRPLLPARMPIDCEAALAAAHLVRPLAEAAPTVDARFAAIIDRCLQPSPASRFASGQELCRALERLDERHRDSDRRAMPHSAGRGGVYRRLGIAASIAAVLGLALTGWRLRNGAPRSGGMTATQPETAFVFPLAHEFKATSQLAPSHDPMSALQTSPATPLPIKHARAGQKRKRAMDRGLAAPAPAPPARNVLTAKTPVPADDEDAVQSLEGSDE